jgi:hypothetical protein
MGESIGGVFLPVKGYFASEKQGWLYSWERMAEQTAALLIIQLIILVIYLL